jgi:hypothetical protein
MRVRAIVAGGIAGACLVACGMVALGTRPLSRPSVPRASTAPAPTASTAPESTMSTSAPQSTVSTASTGEPCTVQAVLATHAGCGIDPRLAHLGERLRRPPYSAFSCFRPAPPSPSSEAQLLERRGRRLRVRLRTSRITSTATVEPGAHVLVGDGDDERGLRLLAFTCR